AILDERIRVIPNPADKYVYVEIGKQGDYEMRLLNEVGQLIATRRTRQIDVLNTANLVSGIYFLQILDKLNNTIHAQKIIVQH
ncbi:MAG: hypothetical protein JWO06_1031, partial [Bacteroidota bacterium]|nr:hypothetical protein [Bacteroidota bacterium]